MKPESAAALERSWRVIGVVLVADGRALDLALIETDGDRHLRRIETGRVPLLPEPSRREGRSLTARVADEVRSFMGNRALQPFAVDRIGLAGPGSDGMAEPLAALIEVPVTAIDLNAGLGPAAPDGTEPFARAELVAVLAAGRGDTSSA